MYWYDLPSVRYANSISILLINDVFCVWILFLVYDVFLANNANSTRTPEILRKHVTDQLFLTNLSALKQLWLWLSYLCHFNWGDLVWLARASASPRSCLKCCCAVKLKSVPMLVALQRLVKSFLMDYAIEQHLKWRPLSYLNHNTKQIFLDLVVLKLVWRLYL
jgi:hypothetical protein